MGDKSGDKKMNNCEDLERTLFQVPKVQIVPGEEISEEEPDDG